MYQLTTATQKIAKLRKRIRAVQGGTSASKTISILLLLINQAQLDETPKLTSIVSESFPHLKRGVMRDFLNILEDQGYYVDDRWNKTDYIYSFESGSRIEFFSVDQPDKVRGPRRDRLFINEANNIPFGAFDQLEIRTNDFIYLDWNPTSEYWYYTELEGRRNDCEKIVLTYKDNEALPDSIRKTIEQRQDNKNWWRVYGEGKLGEMGNKIYKDWRLLDEIPHEAKLIKYGLDFGYTNDPAALVAVYYLNGGYILDEILFQKGLSNKHIADALLGLPVAIVIADSAEPKSIDEIRSYGISILPAVKGPGSVLQRINYTQAQRISATKRSVNVIKEYRNYMWKTDRNGRVLNDPEHAWSHSMDALSYAIAFDRPVQKKSFREKRSYETPSIDQMEVSSTTHRIFTPHRRVINTRPYESSSISE